MFIIDHVDNPFSPASSRIDDMILSRPNHPWLLNVIFLILLLQGVGGAKFTIANRCTQPIWPVVFDNATQQSSQYEVLAGSSVAFQRPSGWNGRVWGKTGCIFNDSGSASCATGDPMQPVTLAEFQVGSSSNFPMDFYDVSVVNGFNLALLVDPIGGTGSGCEPTGCTDELRQVCPPELSFLGGAACQSPCPVFNTPEYCCTGPGRCGPTSYSQLFKKACPTAYSYPLDDDGALFTCTHPDYFITFCPPNHSLIGMPPARPPQSYNYNPHQETRGKNRAKRKNLTMVVSVSVSGVIVLVSIAILVFFVKRRRHSQNGPNQAMENLLLQHRSLAPKRYRYSEIKKITNSLSDKLGQGGFGSVYRGMLPDGRLVAVKILSEMDSNGEEFINEVASISRTSHVNIVTLLGFCYEGNKRALVYEFMPNKSLDKFLGDKELAESGDRFLDLKKLYEIAVGIAKGLEYLHTGCITRIIHFDIKPQNILLDQDLCPKISDFGLAKLCKKKQSALTSMLGTRGTAGYIAPEVFSRNFGAVSHKSDVYSYGMMLLGMAGATENGIEIQSYSDNYFPDKFYEQLLQVDVDVDVDVDVANNLDEVMNEEEEDGRRRKMLLIGFWCIQTIPSDRPSMSKVVEMLEGSLQSIQIPPKPFLFSHVVSNHETSSSFSPHVDTQNMDGY